MGLRIAVDFDGTLVERGEPLRWRPNALAVLRHLKEVAGHTLILHSCRLNPAPVGNAAAARAEADEFWRTGTLPAGVQVQWDGLASMHAFLAADGAWDLFDSVWQGQGKPDCDIYLDDRGEAPEDWLAVWRSVGVE